MQYTMPYSQKYTPPHCFFHNFAGWVNFNFVLFLFLRYVEKLKNAESAGVKKAMLLGGSMGAFHIVMFGCYALAFW